MNAKKGFSKKELADQNAKVADLAKEEAKLVAAIDRGERALAENRDKLKDTQKARSTENAMLEQMIQKGIRAAARGESDQRAALIAALLMGSDGDGADPEPQLQLKPSTDATPSPTPAPAPAPSSSDANGDHAGPASGEEAQNEAA